MILKSPGLAQNGKSQLLTILIPPKQIISTKKKRGGKFAIAFTVALRGFPQASCIFSEYFLEGPLYIMNL